jgi:hypothetical protein
MSVLYLTQNLFPPGERSRTISLNSHVLVVFRNPRDSLGVSTLARQMFPKHTGYLLDAFHDAPSRPYGYLVIDCHQLTPENMRLRTNVMRQIFADAIPILFQKITQQMLCDKFSKNDVTLIPQTSNGGEITSSLVFRLMGAIKLLMTVFIYFSCLK